MATLINVATPGPALNLSKTTQTTTGTTIYSDAMVPEATAGTVYQLDSISIAAGTWLIVGVTGIGGLGPQTNYLNLATATGSNSWPVQASASSTTTNMVISAVVKVSGTTTIYLNGKSSSAGALMYPAMFAVQIA